MIMTQSWDAVKLHDAAWHCSCIAHRILLVLMTVLLLATSLDEASGSI